MTRYAQVSRSTGVISGVIETDYPGVHDGFVDADNDILYKELGDEWPDPGTVLSTFYWKNGSWASRVPQPSDRHYWDPLLESWVIDLPALKQEKKLEIERERAVRNELPLQYGDKLVDGDSAAQRNLSAKLEEVRARIHLGVGAPPEMLTWRDHDNITHTWETLESYYGWLSGYALALSNRGTRLYVVSWGHKAHLDALSTEEEIQSFDTSAGWDEPI